MEFAKCHLQLQHGAAQAGPGYRSSLHCLQSTFAQHGVTGLYKGATVWFVFSGPRSSIRFATFEVAKRNNLFYGSDFWCGMLAGIAEGVVCQTAMQSIQIKLLHDASPAVAVKRYSHLGFLPACGAIYAHHGVGGFFQGMAPAVAKSAVTNALRFVGYHFLIGQLSAEKPTAAESMLCGGVSGAASAVISQPLDTIKANMMGLDAGRYNSSVDCAMAIVRADGPLALWNGVAPRTARVFLEVGLQFTMFEYFTAKLDAFWDDGTVRR
mmetsp:Transcript_21103/g.72975  ORF Transcript_21103/g.72975 Transcript_21103/m.72975 type:complete len:267 (-) Transcript_21103:30-830(-)